MNISETANKLKQFGVNIRLKGNDDDKRRILNKHCDQIGISPVFNVDGVPAF